MNTISSFLVVLVILTMSTGCKSDRQNKVEGGVDGSGGELRSIVDVSFSDWVKYEHRYFVRDLIHRLGQLKKNSPQDLKTPSGLLEKFIGEDIGELQKLADSIEYYSVPNACPSSNHPISDASVGPDKRVCFSYQAFQRFTTTELVRKLLAMTIHEMAHLRGFDESDAQSLQLYFEDNASLGTKTILVNNYNYSNTRKLIGNIGTEMSLASGSVLGRGQYSTLNACKAISRAEAQSYNATFSIQRFPSFIKEKFFSDISLPLHKLALDCGENLSSKDLAQGLADIMENFLELGRIMAFYESPICVADLCIQRETIDAIAVEDSLLQWSVLKPYFEIDQEYPANDSNDVTCRLRNMTDNKEVSLNFSEGFFDFKESEDAVLAKSIDHLLISKSLSNSSSPVQVELDHNFTVVKLKSDGFSASPMRLRGYLQKGTKERVTLEFSVMNPNTEPERRIDAEGKHNVLDTPFYSFDPSFDALKRKPFSIKNYSLECEFKK